MATARHVLQATVILALLASPAFGQEPRTVTVGTIVDGPYGRFSDETGNIREQVLELLEIDFEVLLPPEAQIQADWTVAGIEAGLDQLLSDPAIDLVVTLGFVSSHLVSQRTGLSKPVVAPLTIDPEFQGLPRREQGSGVPNLNYIAVHDIDDLMVFNEIVPHRRLGILIDARLLQAIPDAVTRAEVAAGEVGAEVQMVPISDSVDDALARLNPEVEAVYILPLLQLSAEDYHQLIDGLNARGLASMSWMGEREVTRGAMLGRMPDGFGNLIARRAAINVQRALLGDELATMEVTYPTSIRLTLNVATADAVGFSPTFRLLSEAALIDDASMTPPRQLTLESTVHEAVAENLDLQVADRFLAAADQNAELAGAARLPQIDLDLDFSTIDENRAERSFGASPQVLLSGAATINQVIYADRLWADVEAETLTQAARELDRETLRLDISLQATVSYLNVLRAKTLEAIARDNVNVSQSNLELAQLRVSVGTAAPGEVFRWQNQIAKDRLALVDAAALTDVQEVELNRLLNQPTDEPFGIEETSIDDPGLLSSQQRLYPYLSNPRDFRIFRQFMAFEALERAPELDAIESATFAQERILTSTERSSWLPEFGVQGNVTGWFARAGAGSDQQPVISLPSGGEIALKEVSSFQWAVGVFATIPIFEGTAKAARRTQSAEELSRLNLERASVSEKIDARLRVALLEMRASLQGIELSQQAAEAAHSNLALVTDTYRRGAATIVELLDAQRAALVADEDVANVTYQFLIDLMRVQRAVNRFDFFTTLEDTNDFFNRLAAFHRAASQMGSP